MLEGVSRDVRFGGRMLAKNPGFTAVAAICLALGIGANTTIFTLINAVRLKMLPVQDPAKLVLLHWVLPDGVSTPARSTWGSSRTENGQYKGTSFSYPAFEQIRDRNQVFSGLFGFVDFGRVSVTIDGDAVLGQAQLVTSGAFEVLGTKPALGRSILVDDDRAGADPVAVISNGYWQRQFGGNPAVVGKRIAVNGKPFTVVGVAPPGFTGITPGSADEIWMPLSQLTLIAPERVANGEAFRQNDFWWVVIMARLKPGVTTEAARASVEPIFRQFAMEGAAAGARPDDRHRTVPGLGLYAGSQGVDNLRRELDKPLSIMMVVVFVVALIACANVANLLLARAAVRQKEIAIRLSLGTSRARLVRQLLTESAMLAALGTGLGMGFAYFGSRTLLRMVGQMDGIDLSPDLTVLGFTMAAASATTLLFGLAPALRATALEPFLALRETTGAGGRHALGLARFLVVAQVALSLVLLSGASLFVRSLQNLRGVELGFDQSRLLLFGINANQAGLKGAELAQLYERIQAAIGRLPGVQSATMTPYRLLSSSSSNYSVSVPGYVPAPGERASARVLLVGESFFATLGIPILMGRELDGRDAESAPLVAVANQAFIGKYLGGRSAVGQTFSFGRDSDKPVEIVGIARNARYDRLRGDFAPTLYVPIRQSLPNLSGLYFEVKTTRDPLSVVPDVRKSVAAIHPGIPLFGIRTQAEQIEELLRPERLFALLTSFFGVLALALVCVGLYGIISYGVAMRTTEIGVRMALGARPPDIVRMVLRETGGLVARGVALGLPAAFAGGYFASSVVSSILFGIPSTDTLSLLAATLLMALIGSLAGVLPARRASAVAPMSALRCE